MDFIPISGQPVITRAGWTFNQRLVEGCTMLNDLVWQFCGFVGRIAGYLSFSSFSAPLCAAIYLREAWASVISGCAGRPNRSHSQISAARPNATSTSPQQRLIEHIAGSDSLCRTAPAAVLKISHHKAEPTNIPSTTTGLEMLVSADFASDANTPAKESIVIGLLNVRKNVETKLSRSPFPSTFAGSVAGGAVNVRHPRQINIMPPTSCSHHPELARNAANAPMPTPAISPYIASATAAPIPQRNPVSLPADNVRFMHRSPIGPTGAAIEKPIIAPLINNSTDIRLPRAVCSPADAKKGESTPTCTVVNCVALLFLSIILLRQVI